MGYTLTVFVWANEVSRDVAVDTFTEAMQVAYALGRKHTSVHEHLYVRDPGNCDIRDNGTAYNGLDDDDTEAIEEAFADGRRAAREARS